MPARGSEAPLPAAPRRGQTRTLTARPDRHPGARTRRSPRPGADRCPRRPSVVAPRTGPVPNREGNADPATRDRRNGHSGGSARAIWRASRSPSLRETRPRGRGTGRRSPRPPGGWREEAPESARGRRVSREAASLGLPGRRRERASSDLLPLEFRPACSRSGGSRVNRIPEERKLPFRAARRFPLSRFPELPVKRGRQSRVKRNPLGEIGRTAFLRARNDQSGERNRVQGAVGTHDSAVAARKRRHRGLEQNLEKTMGVEVQRLGRF